MNIRKFLTRFRTLDDLVTAWSVAPEAAAILRTAMREGTSVVVSGATHAGKTTLLGALIAAAPAHHRIVTVEETFELNAQAPTSSRCRVASPASKGPARCRCAGS
ncbi:hypothetical protein AYL44_03605 [Microbacterium oleivorans]|uniref:Bacterial type II secretion system protein E domain-containing protein n=1 Tax=Microbacterium oleivorans TaxID=273677 RepID=A0A177KD94_9MICO|nr:hypothetical protein AYL44_03605 [Microbacterium oleivorans]